MKTFLALGLSFLGIFACMAVAGAQNTTYVRKNLDQDFFIPTKDKFNQPEKLPPLQIIKPEEKKVQPEYQNKYKEYQKEVDLVAKTGEIPDNAQMNEALKEMSGGETFEVKNEAPSQNSDVKSEFDR